MSRNEVKVDSRGYVNLNFRTSRHDRYLADEDADGTIHLVPAVLVPARLKAPEEQPLASLERERTPMDVLREFFPEAAELGEEP